MNYKFSNNNIKVLYKSGPAESGKLGVNTEIVDTTEVTQFSKVLLENFLNTKNKTEAIAYLKRTKEGLAKMVQLAPGLQKECSKQIDILEKWAIISKGVFDEQGIKLGEVKKETLKQITGSLCIPDAIASTLNTPEKLRAIDEFKKNNPIEQYKNKLLEFCIEHPQLASKGRRFSKENIVLKEELQKITTLGIGSLPEYKALIETLLHVVKTKEFDSYTGFFSVSAQKLEGHGSQVEEYKRALKSLIGSSIQTRQTQKPEKILVAFQEKEKAEEVKKRQEAKEAEMQLRKTVNKDTILATFKGNSREEIQKSLKQLDTLFQGGLWAKHGRYLGTDVSDILNMLATAKKAAENDILENSMWNRIGGERTRSAFIENVGIAIHTSIKDNQITPVLFTNGKYEAIDKQKMYLMFSNPESINIEFWKDIFKETYWENTLSTYAGRGNLWAVGKYIQNKGYNTRLLSGITDPKRKSEVQAFFDKQIDTHVIESSVNTSKLEYTDRLYERIKNSIPGISLEIFQKIAPDGRIRGSELYRLLTTKMSSPESYIAFEKNLQKQMGEFNKELDKEIKENVDILKKNGVETVSQSITLFKGERGTTEASTKGLQHILGKKISDLSAIDAKMLLDFLGKTEGNDPMKQTILGLIQKKLNKKTNNENKAGSLIRSRRVEEKGLQGVESVRTGTLDKIELSAGDAYAATEDMKEQREFMKKDQDIVDILKKYGYTVDMLSNPSAILALHQKIKSMSDGPEKNKLMSFLDGMKRSQEIQIRSYDAIIQEAGREDSVGYISSISGKKETAQSIQAYEFMSQNIIQNVEYTHVPLGEQLSRMNVGEVRPLDAFVDRASLAAGSTFVKEYDVELSSPDSYIVRVKNGGPIIGKSLNVAQTAELVDTMSLFDAVGLNDLIPHLPMIKKEISLKDGLNTALDGESGTGEKTKLLQKMYELIFGERKETTDLNEMIRYFQSHAIQSGNRIGSMRPYLKQKGLLRDDNTPISEDILKTRL